MTGITKPTVVLVHAAFAGSAGWNGAIAGAKSIREIARGVPRAQRLPARGGGPTRTSSPPVRPRAR